MRLFDEAREDMEHCADLIAEGMAAVRSQLDEYPLTMSTGDERVRRLSTALAAFGPRIRFAIQESDALQDADSADACTEVPREIDEWQWFFEDHAQSRG